MSWLIVAVLASALFTVLWWRQLYTRNATAVDLAWCLSLASVAAYWFLSGDGDALRRLVSGCLFTAAALRLGWHVWHDRMAANKPEDGRYTMLRERFAAQEHKAFFAFYQAQAVFVLAFSLPAWAIAQIDQPFGSLADIIGISIWLIAWLIEWLADHQLAHWRNNPEHAGQTCRHGLWAWSRHPNYFGQWLQSVGWTICALQSPIWFIMLLWPCFVLWLLFRMTGIPYAEKRALQSRGDDYRKYQQHVSPFFPWPPARKVQS